VSMREGVKQSPTTKFDSISWQGIATLACNNFQLLRFLAMTWFTLPSLRIEG